jgi:hypothetical protein
MVIVESQRCLPSRTASGSGRPGGPTGPELTGAHSSVGASSAPATLDRCRINARSSGRSIWPVRTWGSSPRWAGRSHGPGRFSWESIRGQVQNVDLLIYFQAEWLAVSVRFGAVWQRREGGRGSVQLSSSCAGRAATARPGRPGRVGAPAQFQVRSKRPAEATGVSFRRGRDAGTPYTLRVHVPCQVGNRERKRIEAMAKLKVSSGRQPCVYRLYRYCSQQVFTGAVRDSSGIPGVSGPRRRLKLGS